MLSKVVGAVLLVIAGLFAVGFLQEATIDYAIVSLGCLSAGFGFLLPQRKDSVYDVIGLSVMGILVGVNLLLYFLDVSTARQLAERAAISILLVHLVSQVGREFSSGRAA